MIEFEQVEKKYDLGKGASVTAVSGIDLEICRGDFTIIVGRSGSGKTTLLNLGGLLTKPTEGRVLIDGVDTAGLDDRQQSLLRSRKIGFVFQFPSLLPTLTVLENVYLPVMFTKTRQANGKSSQSNGMRERAASLLESVGLSDKLAVFPRQLSAGQQQRVVIARSLMNEPEMILADEPTSNLDEKTEMEIMHLFTDLHQRLGMTIVLVTHTTQLVSAGMRKIEMAAGQILHQPVEAVALPD